MLEVVAHDVRPALADAGGDRRRIRRGGAEPVGDRRQDELRIPERRERNEDGASLCVVAEQARQLDREPRLAGASRADDREDPRISLVDQRDRVEQLLLAAEERRCRSRKLDASRRPERRELALAELVEANRAIEVLEPVLPEIAERLRVEQRRRRRRDEDLVAVRERRDARAAVDVQPDVALAVDGVATPVCRPIRARTGPACEPVAGAVRRLRRSSGRRESDEERVALGVDLDSAVRGAASRTIRRCSASASAYPAGPSSCSSRVDALDVGEEERDRSFGKRAHFPNDYAAVVPNQRLRRLQPNSAFSAARSSDGPTTVAVGDGPPRKFASTFATRPLPNSR